jgi:pyruvate/2-oxoglutarate dehydrogenase complex dihydrolipoamide dehydrogenase (E3) component
LQPVYLALAIPSLYLLYLQVRKERGIDLIRGKAQFTSSQTIKVDDTEISADKFVLALGSKTAAPPIEGVEHTLTSTDVLSMRELPKKMAIIGGGVIAMEFSHARVITENRLRLKHLKE